MIWLVGGTTESHILGDILKDSDHVITYATREGLELSSGNSINKEVSTEKFIKENDIDYIVDVTHPFAVKMTEKVKKSAEKFNIPYIRYERDLSEYPKDAILVENYEECFDYLKDINGTVFFTTGSNMVGEFEKVKGNNRFIYRILPSSESIQKIRNLGVEMKNIIAMLGPFSEEMNYLMFKEMKADYVVTKDSGKIGGSIEKFNAANRLGLKLIIITRKAEESLDWDKFVEEVKKIASIK